MPIDEQLSADEAKALYEGGLGKFELEFVSSLCTPIYWAVRDADGQVLTRNGTAFFLDAGEGVFGVTACHVIDGWRHAIQVEDVGPLRLAGNDVSPKLDLDVRLIDEHPGIDLATFRVTEEEVRSLGKIVLTGWQRSWPPGPPTINRGIYYCGFPGVGTLHPSTGEAVFGAVCGSGIASSVNERDVSTLIEREYLLPVLGGGVPPDDFDYRGMSGGPMLTVIENKLRSWALSGVLVQGPNVSDDPDQSIPGLTIFKARRAHFILSDGKLDRARWDAVSSW